jgi:hypothetical protein
MSPFSAVADFVRGRFAIKRPTDDFCSLCHEVPAVDSGYCEECFKLNARW